MKLTPRTFQIYWDAHAWAGVLAALLLYVTFFMGGCALFRQELNLWANPSFVAASGRNPNAGLPALQPLLEQLDRQQPLQGKDRVAFLHDASGLRAYWHAGDQHQEFRHSERSGRLEPLHSNLGSFLYSLHYLGVVPNGVYLAGLAALALLLALVTGLLLHLERVGRPWFQFRSARGLRTWASDLHKLLGVLGLPYQLAYAWTGAMLGLSVATIEPAFRATLFGGDRAAADAVRGDAGEPPAPSQHLTGQLPQLDELIARAVREVPEMKPNWIGIEYVGDERSSVSVYGDVPEIAFGSAGVMLNASDGAVLGVMPAHASNGLQRFEAWFYGLHYARYGGVGVKLLYALFALLTCATIVTGNLVWLERRDASRAHWGNRLLERLTVGWCAGSLLGTSALFCANRAWTAAGSASALSEQTVFWLVWALAALAPCAWRESRRVSGVELLLCGGLLFAAVGLDQVCTAGSPADPLRRSVNAGLLLLALASVAGSARLLRPREQPHSLVAAGADLREAE